MENIDNLCSKLEELGIRNIFDELDMEMIMENYMDITKQTGTGDEFNLWLNGISETIKAVPILWQKGWIVGFINEKKAFSILSDYLTSTFLIRFSFTYPHLLMISMKLAPGVIKHYKIDTNKQKQDEILKMINYFPHLQKVIKRGQSIERIPGKIDTNEQKQDEILKMIDHFPHLQKVIKRGLSIEKIPNKQPVELRATYDSRHYCVSFNENGIITSVVKT